jgi:pyrimidine-specific ribonucleoside hydrolase
MLARDHLDQIARTIQKLIFIGGRLTNVPPAQPVEFSVGHDPEPRRHRPRGGLTITMYGLEIVNQVVVSEAATARLAQLTRRRPCSRASCCGYGLIGDAGALIMLTDPDLFQVRRAAVRIGLHGAEPGRTLIDPAAPVIDVIRCECGSGRAAICRCHP